MLLLRKGAEAELYLDYWYGLKVIRKVRKPKAYRLPRLDLKIRQSRTGREAQVMHDSKLAGVPTPTVLMVDLKATTIIMEHVEGVRIKESLQILPSDERKKLCTKLGQYIGRLHRSKIIHGDLTTSNMIFTKKGEIFFIDFGLSEHSDELEKRGVDLLLMKRAFYSTHHPYSEECFKAVTDGYANEMGEKMRRQIIERVEEIAKRGRYTIRS